MRKAGSHSHPTPIPAVLQLRPGARAQDNHPTSKSNVVAGAFRRMPSAGTMPSAVAQARDARPHPSTAPTATRTVR